MVGKLTLKNFDHWNNVSTEHWKSCGIDPRIEVYGAGWHDNRISVWSLQRAMVRIQQSLVNAVVCKDNNMILNGKVMNFIYNRQRRRYEKETLRCPYHEDLLPNFEQFIEQLESYDGGIEQFSISKVMLPPSPFFSTRIMSVLNENITTIISLELVDSSLQASDVASISKFVKKNKILGTLNLSENELFDNDDGYNAAAKLLSKSIKKHPELSYVNLTSTGLGNNNEALEIILDASRGVDSFIMEDRGGLITMMNFFEKKKSSITTFSMDSMCIADGDSARANVKALKQCLAKNTTLEQLSLGSNDLGEYKDRIFSTVMSGMKGSASLVYVDLSRNEIRRMPTVKLLAKYLSSNPSLVGLDLSHNRMPTKNADVLIESLKKNTTLESLFLTHNNIGDKSVAAFTNMLQNNTTLRTLDLQRNNLKIHTGRKGMLRALWDTSSLDLDSIMNSNHTCSIIIAGKNYGGTYEEELNKINALENEGEKIRYKIVLALCALDLSLGRDDPRVFDNVSLELMPRLLELIQLEIGCNGYGEGIAKSVRKRNTINRLSNIYEAIHQWPAFPSLFMRGPGKDSLTKTGKLKRKREKTKRVPKVADEDEDWSPAGARKKKRRQIGSNSGRSRRNTTTAISYADVENSEDES